MLKLTQILEHLAVRGKFVVFFFLFCSLYKTNRFHVAMGLFGNRSQRTSKCGENISDSPVYGSCATSLFLPLWSITEQTHGNMESICKRYYKVRWLQICYSTHPKLLHAWCYILLKNAKTQFRTWKRKLEK